MLTRPLLRLNEVGILINISVFLFSLCDPVHVSKRENPIVNRLNKTKVEKMVDHEQERVDRIKAESAVRRAAAAEKVCYKQQP